jgi:dTDP-4-amino-4,6-dideoxy-D-galactose acyltransferase
MFNIKKLKGQNFECYPLDWDTEYFGVKSARVNLSGIIREEDQNKIMEYCKSYEFITISNLGNMKENNQWIGKKSNAFLTDMNIQFLKTIQKEPDFIDDLTEVHKSYHKEEKVVYIAQSAFSYSRFFNDSGLPKQQADNIYLHWTECAFQQENKYFIITKRNDEVAGYVLFSMNIEDNSIIIELIAVDDKYQGQRVGKSLISKLESFMFKKGIKKIKVGTQIDNGIAIRFYTTCGFQYETCNSVYHLWMNKT